MLSEQTPATRYLITRRFVGAVGAVTEFCVTLIGIPAMLRIADRDVIPAFAGIVYVTLPDPVADPVNVIHEAVVDDVQAHVDDVVTVIVPVPPPAGAVTRSGVTENVHDTLGSVTTKLLPAIVSKAVFANAVVFDAAVNPTLPEPVPLVPLEIVTHDAPLAAVQLHPAVVVTITVPLPPAAVSDWLVGEIVYEQGAAAWVTVNVLLPIVNVPVRETVPVFAATE